MPPGSAAPAGEARRFRTAPSPRLPPRPARSLGTSQGPRGAARGFGICAQIRRVGTEESSAFRRGALSTRGRAMDGDARNLWLNWRSSWGLARTNVFVDNKNEFSRDQCEQWKLS